MAQCDFFMVHRHYKVFVRTSLEKVLDTRVFVHGPSRSGHLKFTNIRENLTLFPLMKVPKFCLILQCRTFSEILTVFLQNLTYIVLRILINSLEIKKLKNEKKLVSHILKDFSNQRKITAFQYLHA